ncbi:MAG: hypothetical protein ACLQVI_35770 [Polyangiaceae bacterium]
MNPLRSAETEAETESSEALERELFARRARALDPVVVPSLASVLRAAEVKREARVARGARVQTFAAMALAAACMVATLTKLPRTETRRVPAESIAAERDASAGAPMTLASAEDVPPGATCSMEEATLPSEERACVMPAPLFTPAPASPCTSVAHDCDPNESCAIGTP